MYTGHKQTKVGGRNIADWMQATMQQESQLYNIPMPTPQQIGLVMSGLRMHTIMVHASDYDTSELHQQDKVTDFYPIQSSIGRWLRDAGRELMDETV